MFRWIVKVVASLNVLLAIAAVAVAATTGLLFWNHAMANVQERVREELPPLASKQIPLVFGYDYQTIERSFTNAYELLSPDFRKEFRDRATKDIIPQARDRQLVSQVNVVGVGMLAAQLDSGSVLVFMNRTVTDKSKQSVYDGSRVQVDYQKVDGQWLIKYIKPL